MRLLRSSFLLVIASCLLSCSDLGTPPAERFPEGFYRAGSDSDHSYVSLQTIRLKNGDLLARLTGWGYYETGLFLSSQNQERILTLRVMDECGTVLQLTWTKVTFDHTLARIDEDDVDVLRAVGGRNEIVVRKHM